MERLTDEELLRHIADRDVIAFEHLYDRYARAAYSLAVRIAGDGTAEDVIQEAFLSVWRMAHTYDERRGPVRSWLLGTVHHRAVDVYRKGRGKLALDASYDEHWLLEAGGVWEQVVLAVDTEALRAALAELPMEQREAIELAYFGGYSHREIAKERELPLGTVKGRIRMGMDKLRERMKTWREGS